jgi:isocitrate dehydrogenase (NAD+)
MKSIPVVELAGDGISAELSASVHALAERLPCRLEFRQVDLSVASRLARGPAVYDEAVAEIRRAKVALKYPTETREESPNAILRERCDFAVIHRPVMTIPGVASNFKRSLDIDVVRIATGGTYDDMGRRIGSEAAVSLRVIERTPCRMAARFAFKLAMLRGKGVVSASKHTIQKATDGLFEEVVAHVALDYPTIQHRKELFDALLANLIIRPERYGVIVCPNEYGDFLSDMACGLVGSIGIGDSASYAFDGAGQVTLAMFDPAGGTAPDIAGKGTCNPTAALLALSSLLRHVGQTAPAEALKQAIQQALAAGERTADLDGELGTRAFTEVVTARMLSILG